MILDTNALSAFADEDAKFEPVLRLAKRCAIPVIVLGEYRYGISQSKHHDEYRAWLKAQLRHFELLSVIPETAGYFAELRLELKKAGTPTPANDLWIAALARQHNLPIASRDTHFDLVSGVRRIGW
ncbi:MAG: type II toxin-antitoxin system VapC family toxin [Verrucomicrobia bacterium]|nr:type II toxin-antitoxin system VapC family toxin [Verrucomicrobiota bacterium]